jgi:hypothetical protein
MAFLRSKGAVLLLVARHGQTRSFHLQYGRTLISDCIVNGLRLDPWGLLLNLYILTTLSQILLFELLTAFSPD